MEQSRMEYILHLAAFDYLKGEEWSGNKIIRRHTKPFPHLEVFHAANESRDATTAYFARRMGAWTGFYDIGALWPVAQAGFQELKIKGGKLSREQKTFDFTVSRMGFRTAVAYSVAEVRDNFIKWGLECLNPACREPNYATWDDRINAYLEFIQ